MKPALVLAACGVAVMATGLTGCSSDTSTTATTEEVTVSEEIPSAPVSASAGAGTATVTIDGAGQDIDGQVVCTTSGGNLTIAVGDTGRGIAVVMADDASEVTSVSLGNIDGVIVGVDQNAPAGAEATATKDGDSYTISGTASGIDMANPTQPITKPFEIQVSCP